MDNHHEITFERQERLAFRLPPKVELIKWLVSVIRSEKKQCGKISFFFCTDKYLLELNKKFLHHDYYTDILTFDYSAGKTINGEIFISIERVKENAIAYSQSFRQELLRTIVHGVLHLCGNNDKTAAEKNRMRKKEDTALNLFLKHSWN
ncbi:MAG: rRNA maturation RNase YbeY [Bacteroidia bacterium]|jgi:rRNA maturation RNase YbeY|nr:rRNA maturation RNase YbeY [Bacteroidia bacterium]